MRFVLKNFAWSLILINLLFPLPSFAATPVIIDTDMGFDDWMAILYLAKEPKANIIAISIDCYGETYCRANRPAANAARLLKLAGHKPVPIIMGKRQPKNYWPQFPAGSREYSWRMSLPGFTNLPYSDNTIIKTHGIAALEKIIVKAGKIKQPVKIISIGSATNLASAWQLATQRKETHLFRAGIKMIYKGGGAFGTPLKSNMKATQLQLSNYNIAGNINFPGFYLTNNTQAAWNIYVAVPAMQDLIASGLPITFVPINLTNDIPINKNAYRRLVKAAKRSPAAAFIATEIKSMVASYGGWANNNLDFWDPSVAVAAMHPEFVTQNFKHIPVCVNIHAGKIFVAAYDQHDMPFYLFSSLTLPYYYGAVLVNRPFNRSSKSPRFNHTACQYLDERSNPVDIYWHMSQKIFYNEFIEKLL